MKRDLAAAALLIALTMAVHGPVVGQWWLWDDPQLLYGAIEHRLADFFVSPEVWRQQSATNFVPLLLAAYETDLALFGLSPRMFYIHHLGVFALTIVAIYAYVRTFSERAIAFIAAAMVVLSPSAFTIAALLMDRHYAEGLLLALCALLLFRFSHDRPKLAIAGAAIYLLAALEKEVFVPLPLLVVVQDFVTRRPWRVLLRNALASGIVSLLYLAWRIAMLGSFGGYGRGREGIELARLPIEVWTKLTGFSGPGAMLVVAAVAAVLLVMALRRAALSTLVVVASTAFVVLLPLVALRALDHRYVFVATAALAITGAAAIGSNRIALSAFVALALLVAIGGWYERAFARASFARMEAQGRYLWDAPPGARPILTVPNGWYVEGIRWLRRHVKGEDAPRAIASIPGLLLSRTKLSELTVLDRSPESLRASYAAIVKGHDRTMPLSVAIRREGQSLHWTLGPHQPGVRWYFVAQPSFELLELDPVAWTRFPTHFRAPTYDVMPDASRFRIIRMHGGRWNVTAELPWPRDGQRYGWATRP